MVLTAFDELKQRSQWVCWRLEERDGKTTKIPYDPSTGRRASSTDPATWGTYDQAVAGCKRYGCTGIGFVFSEADPYVGVDLDHCRNAETGELEAWAQELIADLNSYAELSPSRTGVHIFVRGQQVGERNRAGQIEVYARGRYFTWTGHHLGGTPNVINENQPALDRLFARLQPPKQEKKQPAPVQPSALDDEALLELARSAANGAEFTALWNGDTSAYGGDESRADLALCMHLAFWTGRDTVRMDRLFRQSGRYRQKWERPDYRERTLRRAIEQTTEVYTPGGGYRPAASTFHLTDLGNAERLVARHGQDLRYCHNWGKWLVWDGRRFAIDETGEPDRRAEETIRSIYAEAAEVEDKSERKALVDHARRSESRNRLQAMVALAQHKCPVRSGDLDSDPWLLNVANGVLDLRTGELHAHARERLCTKLAPINYDPGAVCPTWDAFLSRIMSGNSNLVAFLQRAVGYSLTGNTSEQCLFILHGTGANGKSTFLTTIGALLGDYAAQTPTDTLMVKRGESIPNDLARLVGTRFVTAVEAEEGRRLAESLVKQLTGGDKITARFMRAEWFEFTPRFKVWLGTNHRPAIRGTDHGIWRRIRLIPFTVTIPESERDPDLPEKLREELPGILAWAVRGCLEWQRSGLGVPDEVKRANDMYRAEQDVLAGFLDQCCVVAEGARAKVGDVWEAYVSWSGERISPKALSQRLQERGFRSKKGRAGVRFWLGLGLLDDSQVADVPQVADGGAIFGMNEAYFSRKGKPENGSSICHLPPNLPPSLPMDEAAACDDDSDTPF